MPRCDQCPEQSNRTYSNRIDASSHGVPRSGISESSDPISGTRGNGRDAVLQHGGAGAGRPALPDPAALASGSRRDPRPRSPREVLRLPRAPADREDDGTARAPGPAEHRGGRGGALRLCEPRSRSGGARGHRTRDAGDRVGTRAAGADARRWIPAGSRHRDPGTRGAGHRTADAADPLADGESEAAGAAARRSGCARGRHPPVLPAATACRIRPAPDRLSRKRGAVRAA